jgi:hypothetical protein
METSACCAKTGAVGASVVSAATGASAKKTAVNDFRISRNPLCCLFDVRWKVAADQSPRNPLPP